MARKSLFALFVPVETKGQHALSTKQFRKYQKIKKVLDRNFSTASKTDYAAEELNVTL